jgi:hypothetical protein
MPNLNRRGTTILLFVLAATLVSVTAFAQTTDFAGEWANRTHEDEYDRNGSRQCPGPQCGGPALGDYLGIALNEAGRMRADTADVAIWDVPEFQCRPHVVPYIWRAAGGARITKEIDPVSRELVAYHVNFVRSMDRTVYMDGRTHPPEYAAHTWEGFSTGEWDGNILVVTTTHHKEGYLRRNDVMYTDQAKITEFWTRHGDIFTMVGMIDDPIYLEEPWIFSISYKLDIHTELDYFPCTVVEGLNDSGRVPHTLPGNHPHLTEWLPQFGIPLEAARGYRETLYPEYQLKIKPPIGIIRGQSTNSPN